MDCSKTDFAKLQLVPEKKGYRILYGGINKLKINTFVVFSPFGIENYNGKNILNILIKSNNIFLNQIDMYNHIYEQFSDQTILYKDKIPHVNIPINFKKDIYNKNYKSFLKDNSTGKLMRTTVRPDVEIYKIVDNIKVPIKGINIKAKNIKCELELSNLWISESEYGLLWNVTKIELLE